jgi:TolB protein
VDLVHVQAEKGLMTTLRPLLTLGALCALAAPLAAQDRPTGIKVEGIYDVRQRPVLAVRPFAGAGPIAEVIDSMTTIVARDLRFSDRYNMIDQIPQELRTGEVDVAKWNALRVTYLVTGEVTPTTSGYQLRVVVHDVPWNRITYDVRYRLPAATAANFRMAVHADSDDVVKRTVNAPGIAATRVAFTRTNRVGANQLDTYDLIIVDSDGFGVRRIAGYGGQLYSPSWSPDGSHLLYTANRDPGGWQLVEREITTGRERTIKPGGEMVSTPTYSPRDGLIVLALWRNNRNELTSFDITRNCCAQRISAPGRFMEQSPTFSHDGRLLAFTSTRSGPQAVYVANADGSNPTMITPFVAGQSSDYAAPDFSPTDTRLIFAGDWNIKVNGYRYHIMMADAARPGSQIIQLTTDGKNEDPSWAPDGRHIVYTQTEVRGQADGLYVIDGESKIRRLLVNGARLRMADWSAPLMRAADITQ